MLPIVNQIKPEVIRLLKENECLDLIQLREQLAKIFNLTDEDLNAEYDSANGNKFKCLTQWAVNALRKGGEVERLKKGVYKLSIEGDIASNFIATSNEETPRERLENSYESLLESIYLDILDTAFNKISPTAAPTQTPAPPRAGVLSGRLSAVPPGSLLEAFFPYFKL